MSVDSLLTRLNAQQFDQFLENPASFHQHATDDETYFEAIQTIPAHAQIQSLIIDEHTLGMFAHVHWGESVFNLALIDGKASLSIPATGEVFFYLTPDNVREIASQIKVMTDDNLRDLFNMNPDSNLADWVSEYKYEDEAALLAYQKSAYQNILRFYEEATAAGDAIVIQYE